MWYVGIDGALTKSGVVALGDAKDLQQKVPYDELVIHTKSDPQLEPRLHFIRIEFNKFIRGLLDYKRMPLYVAIESKFQGVGGAKQFGVLSKVDAIFSLASYDFCAEGIFHVNPTKLKKFICETSYRIDKTAMAERVYQDYGYERTSTDLVDAYGLAHYARCAVLGTGGGYRGWQVDVVAPHNEQITVLV